MVRYCFNLIGFVHQNESWCEVWRGGGGACGVCVCLVVLEFFWFWFWFCGFFQTFYKCSILLAYFYRGYPLFCVVLGLGSGGGNLGVWRGSGDVRG